MVFQVTKRYQSHQKPTADVKTAYKHNDTHFLAQISFFWLNSLLYRGYESPLEQDHLGELPDNEQSKKYYQNFKKKYKDQEVCLKFLYTQFSTTQIIFNNTMCIFVMFAE